MEPRRRCGSQLSAMSVGRREMDEAESLYSVIETGVALAGFAGIIVAIGARPERWRPVERFRIVIILFSSLGAAALAALALVLRHSSMNAATAWRFSSVFYLILGTIFLRRWVMARQQLSQDDRELLHPAVFTLFAVGQILALAVQVPNALGVWGLPAFTPFFGGLVWGLVAAGVQFVRTLLVRPSE
jgi:uncharacterized membrane protein